MSWLNLVSLAGWIGFGALAWIAGGCRRPFPRRTVAGAACLMLLLGAVVFWLPPTRALLLALNEGVLALLHSSNAGAEFLLGPLAVSPGQRTSAGEPSVGFVLAAQVLPAVIFFASIMAALYHLGLIQPLVRLLGRLFRRTLALSGAEALAGSANIFFGVESATSVRPYLERMTPSELLTLLTCGMSTVASTTLAIYVLFLQGAFPQIAGHLISASVLCIPAAALTSKLMLPETGQPETGGRLPALEPERRQRNVMAALATGAWDGLKLAAGIATLLIAVLGVVGLLDLALAGLSSPWSARLGGPLDLSRILSWPFMPLAWLMGIEAHDVQEAGRLLGKRLVLTEVVAYRELGQLALAGSVTPRTLLVMSYALCGFAHVASVGIFVGGVAALAPSRLDDLAALGPRALIASTLATLMAGALAGVFYYGQTGLI